MEIYSHFGKLKVDIQFEELSNDILADILYYIERNALIDFTQEQSSSIEAWFKKREK